MLLKFVEPFNNISPLPESDRPAVRIILTRTVYCRKFRQYIPAARAGLQKSYDFSTLAGSMSKYGKSSITFLLLLFSSYPLAVYSQNMGKDTYLFCSCYSPALRKPQKTSENPLRIHNTLFFSVIRTTAPRKP